MSKRPFVDYVQYIDSSVAIYMFCAVMIVLVAYLVMSTLTETVRTIHERAVEDEKRRRKMEREKQHK